MISVHEVKDVIAAELTLAKDELKIGKSLRCIIFLGKNKPKKFHHNLKSFGGCEFFLAVTALGEDMKTFRDKAVCG